MPRQQLSSRLRIISSRVTAEQYAALLNKANHDGLSLSEYVRRRSLAGLEADLTTDYLRALLREVCSLRTILAYSVANLTAGEKIDAAYMKALFAEADAMKHQDANLRLAQARIRQPQEP